MRLAFGTPLAALLALGWAPGAAASDRKSCADGDPEACARMEALGPAIADCLGGDIDRCAALADEDLDGAPVREHGCDRAGPACEVALQSAERGWLELGDALLFHLREVACARGDAARCEVPADRLTGPRPIGHPGRVVGFDASGALLASSGEDVSGFDPSTASPLDAGTAGNGNVVLDLQPAPDGWTATVLARTGPRREAGDLGLVGPTGEVQWIPGPVCSSRSLPGGGALVVVGRDKSCAEAVALERVDGRGQRIGPRWSWSGPPPTGFDTGPTGLVAVDAAGRLLVKSGAGAPVTVPTPRPIVAARFVGSRILAIAEPGWWLLSPAAGGFRVTGEGPESLDAVAVAPDGSAFVFTHRREQIRYVRRVDPARVGEGVGFALGYEAHRVDADVALSPDGHTVVVGGGGGIDVLDHRPAREVGAWAAPPWTPTKVVGKPQHLVVVDTEGRPVAGASVSSRNGAEHVTGPDGAVVVEPGPVAVTTPDGRSGSVVDSHGRVVVTVHDRVWFRVVDQGGEPVRGLEVRPRGGVGHTWTDADGSGWFYPVGDPVQTVAVGDVSVDPAGGDWVVPQGRVQLPVYPLGTELSWVRDAAGVVHEAPLRLYVEHVARGPAVARVYRDGRVATEAIEVPSWGVVELAPTYAAPATLVVRVLDPDGAPAPGVRVAPQPVERGARAPEPGWSDVDGVVRFTVSDGPWLVEGRDLASRTGEGSVRPEAGSEVAVDLRVDRPADLVWPGWRLDDDGTVLGFADGSPLRALFDPGDHLSTAAGPLRNVDLEHHVRRTTGDFSVVVAAPDGAERTVALPARPTCDRSGRCTLATAGGEVVIRTSTGDRSGADALAPPRWPPPIPVIPPSPDRVACAQGDTAACGRANVYVPEPLPAREWRESGIHIPGHVELVFTADGALVAVSDGTWLAIDPVTGSVVSRSPLATGGEEVLDVRQVVALPDGGVRALVDDRDWVQRAPGGWVQVPVSDGRRVTWIGGSDGRPCGVMPTTDGAVGVWSPDPRCEQRPEVRRWDREGAVLSRTPAPPGVGTADAWGDRLFVIGSGGLSVGPSGGPLTSWSTQGATGVRAVAPDRAVTWTPGHWWLVGPDGPLADGDEGPVHVAAGDGVVAVSTSSGPLRLLDAVTGRPLQEPVDVRVGALAVSADGSTVAFVQDGALAFLDRAPPTAPRAVPAWRPTPELLARSSEDTPPAAALSGSGPAGVQVTVEAGAEPGPPDAVPPLRATVGPDGKWSVVAPLGSYRIRLGEVPASAVRVTGPTEARAPLLTPVLVKDPEGRPVPGALVLGPDGPRGTTGPDGAVEVVGSLRGGLLAVAGDRAGFVEDGVAVLDRTDRSQFKVVDERGQPLAGARLVLGDAGGQLVTGDDGAGWFVTQEPGTVPHGTHRGFDPSVTHGDGAVAATFDGAPIVFPTGVVVAEVPAEARRVVLRNVRGYVREREVDGADVVRFTEVWGGPAEVRWFGSDGRSARSRVRVVPGREVVARWQGVEAPARLVFHPRGPDGRPGVRTRVDLVFPPDRSLRAAGETDEAGVLDVVVPAGPVVVTAGLSGDAAVVARPGETHELWLSPGEGSTEVMWPGVRLGTDGRVVEFEPGAWWARTLSVGDRLVRTPAGRVRGRPIDEVWVELAMAEGPTEVEVLGADGARRTVVLAGRPRCSRDGCVVPDADGLKRLRWTW